MFEFELALALGKTRAEMLAGMDVLEYGHWLALHGIWPFGERRRDLQAGIIASTVANVNRAKGRKAFSVQDFVMQFRKRRKTWQELREFWKSFTEAWHGQHREPSDKGDGGCQPCGEGI